RDRSTATQQRARTAGAYGSRRTAVVMVASPLTLHCSHLQPIGRLGGVTKGCVQIKRSLFRGNGAEGEDVPTAGFSFHALRNSAGIGAYRCSRVLGSPEAPLLSCLVERTWKTRSDPSPNPRLIPTRYAIH